MVPPAGEMSSRDQSGPVLVRTYPGTVCGGLVSVGGGSRGRRGTVPDPERVHRVQLRKGVNVCVHLERC